TPDVGSAAAGTAIADRAAFPVQLPRARPAPLPNASDVGPRDAAVPVELPWRGTACVAGTRHPTRAGPGACRRLSQYPADSDGLAPRIRNRRAGRDSCNERPADD